MRVNFLSKGSDALHILSERSIPSSEGAPKWSNKMLDLRNPHQQTTKIGFKKKCDFYQCGMLKYNGVADFHSYHELLHALLLESDPDVTRFVPQPFRLPWRQNGYVPDCYIARGSQRLIVEIKPEGKFPKERGEWVSRFCRPHGIDYLEITNEFLMAREVKARNWFWIVSYLRAWKDFDSTNQIKQLYEQLVDADAIELGSLIPYYKDKEQTLDLLALFRMAHRGQCELELNYSSLNPDTIVRLVNAS